MTLSPIIVFAYNRPQLLRQTLESLQANHLASESDLYIFCDGPKPNASQSDLQKIEDARKTAHEKQWCKNVTVYESETNKGLGTSIISGVTKIVNEFEKVIVLEDDLILSPYFLEYMNTALEKYENVEKVMQISGYMFPVKFTEPKTDAIFLPYTTTLGWATWNRAWEHLDQTMSGYEKLKNDKKLQFKFDMEGTYPFYKLLLMQKKGKVSSWGIAWYLSVFIKGGLTIHPTQALIKHEGFGNDATHTTGEDTLGIKNTILRQQSITVFPNEVNIDYNSFVDYINYFSKLKINSKLRILKIILNPIKLIKIVKNIVSI